MVVMLDTPCSEAECKTTGYPLHSPLSPSLPLPCFTVCHQVSIELYQEVVDLLNIKSGEYPQICLRQVVTGRHLNIHVKFIMNICLHVSFEKRKIILSYKKRGIMFYGKKLKQSHYRLGVAQRVPGS